MDAEALREKARKGYTIFFHPDTTLPDWLWDEDPIMQTSSHLPVGSLYALTPDFYDLNLCMSGTEYRRALGGEG